MKILYVITSLDVGGAEKALEDLVYATRPHHQVRVLCLKPCGAIGQRLVKAGVEVISLEMKGAGLGTVAKLVQQIDQYQPDIVHALLFRAIEFSRLACAGRGIKLITTPHFDLSQKPFWMRQMDRLLNHIDTISTAESVSTYNYLTQKQHYKKVVYVGNSVKKEQFFKDNELRKKMRQQHQFTDQDVVFISVARLAAVKNPTGLLESFSKIIPLCPHAKLIYVGGGSAQENLQSLIRSLQLEKQVILAGEQQNINDWLNMADVFVLFSKEESLPLSLLEAKSVGLPCIVSKVGDMPNQVEHGKDGFVCKAGDKMLLSCLMTELYENNKLRQEMGSYSLKKTATIVDASQQYQHLYQQLKQEKQ